ncbi:MAG TPA: sensor domain-containing diguanylate cyclase [Kineosporiaceae bacterium]|nr:sensor domain-containing diguanylate cyclase [Kineosporiaceae bacterium]
MTLLGQRASRQAGPDASATPTMPAMPPWLGALVFGVVCSLAATGTRALTGLPFYPVTAVICATVLGAMAQPRAQRWIGEGRLDNRAGLRISLAMAVFGVLSAACGAAFMVPVFAVIVASIHLHWSGWRVWRTVAWQSIAWTAAEEVLTGLGVLPAALPVAREHALAGLSLAMGLQALANLGVTARRREELTEELRWTESRFRALVTKSRDVVAILTPEGTVDYLSPSLRRYTGRPLSELTGRHVRELLPPRALDLLTAAMLRLGAEQAGSSEEFEVELGSVSGENRRLELVVTNLLDDPAVGGFVVNGNDITDSHRFREQLVHTATHDPLTGLLNRSAFVTVLQRELASVSPQTPAWLLFCDLDGFKLVNDGLGHDAGDTVLVHVARRLRQQAGPTAVVGRFGGDEFTVLIPVGSCAGDAHQIRDLLAEAVAQPCPLLDGRSVTVGASFGLVVLDGGRLLADDVLREADQLMYEHKRTDSRR